jgi:hypothetical protein
MAELNNPIALADRYDCLLGYFALMQTGDFTEPVLQRSKVINQLYFDLIYFRDRILVLLKKIVDKKSSMFGNTPYLSEWLLLVGNSEFSKRLRALKNAFAHGKWAFLPDFTGIICYPELDYPYTEYRFSQEDLGIIHALIYSFQIVFFTVLKEQQ